MILKSLKLKKKKRYVKDKETLDDSGQFKVTMDRFKKSCHTEQKTQD